MHGKNRLPVKLEDLQEDQGTYLQDGMVKMPFPLAQPQQLGEAHCLTCICNHTDKHLWCRSSLHAPNSDSQTSPWTLLSRTHKLPLEEGRSFPKVKGNKEKLSQEEETHKNTRHFLGLSSKSNFYTCH